TDLLVIPDCRRSQPHPPRHLADRQLLHTTSLTSSALEVVGSQHSAPGAPRKEQTVTDNEPTTDETIACLLSEREMAARGDLLAQQLFPGVEAVEELPDGYAYRFPGDDTWTANVLDFVAAERRCCPFFTFEVVFTPHGGPLWLHLRGSEVIKEFVREHFQAALGLGTRAMPNAPD